MGQIELSGSPPVLDDSGQPQNFGWSKSTSFVYNPFLIYAPKRMISEADRYIVHSPTHMVVFEVRDDGKVGCMGVSVISLRDKKRSTQVFWSYVPLGTYEMPSSSEKGNVRWRRKKTHLDFISMEGGYKIIKVDIPKFGHLRSMRGELVLSEPENAQSLVNNQPWRNNKYAFKYSRCSPWYCVEGVIQFGGAEIIFTKGNGWGILDWNRGVRTKNDVRYWAAASGMIGGKLLSFCAGYSMADFSVGTENAFFIDGQLHKLDQVTFHIPLSDTLSPWRFTSNDSRLEMTFYPHQERIDRRRYFLYSSSRRQVCGFFSGKVRLDDDTIAEFHNLTGFAERCKVRY